MTGSFRRDLSPSHGRQAHLTTYPFATILLQTGMSQTVVTRNYNPGFLTEDELLASFCVRTSEFESIVETLGENTGNSNQHLMVIGPRGSGKTNLMLRVAIESRRNPELSSRIFPITFAEESYGVSTCGEFWLECLSRLADQAPQPDRAADLGRSCEDLRGVQDDRLLAVRCLGALLDFADGAGKRLLLVVESLDAMFAGMLDPEAGWRLRKTLQTEPRIMLLGTATSRFPEIDRPDRALYDFFRVIELRPLDETECSALWHEVSGEPPATGKIRSLRILTGGIPRLISIVAAFSAGRPLHELMKDVLDLIDVHTEYFRSHLDALPPQERRVCVALAELWKPATTREIADRARLGSSICSAQLKRLIGRGFVSEQGGTPRRKRYCLVEPLYNIYCLLRRRRRGASDAVEHLIGFMTAFYTETRSQRVGDVPASERDLSTNLSCMAEAEELSASSLRTLLVLSAQLGPTPILGAIEGSSAADGLLPLTTALQQEIGLKPRVAREVEEVAHDIRKELARTRTATAHPDTIANAHD